MGIMVYSLLWVLQDLDNQEIVAGITTSCMNASLIVEG